MYQPLHLHPNRLKRSHNVFLFLPALIFIVALALIFFATPHSSTLGEKTENLDNPASPGQ